MPLLWTRSQLNQRGIAVSGYLTLPIIIFLVAIATHVLVQDPRATLNRLFGWYCAVAVVINALGLIRLTSSDYGAVLWSTMLLGPAVAMSSVVLVLLLLALFIPQRYADRTSRRLIVLPYMFAVAALALDALLGLQFVYSDPTGTNLRDVLVGGGIGRVVISIYFLLGQIFPLAVVATALVRGRGGRGPSLALLIGMLLSDVLAAISPALGIPMLSYFGQVPLFLAFGWIVARYQIFRPPTAALQTAIESLPDGILILDDLRRVRYCNPAARGLLGDDPSRNLTPFAAALEQADLHDRPGHKDGLNERRRLVRGRASPITFEASETLVRDEREVSSIVVLRDISAAEQQAAALEQLKAVLEQRKTELDAFQIAIRQRDEVIAGLSLPLIPIADGVLVLPLIGSFDIRRSDLLMRRLLEQIESEHPEIVLMDLTGITSFDESLANSLRQTIEGARLMGSRVALCGVRPDLAESILHEQIDLRNVGIYSTLQRGVSAVGGEG
jgi:anti-anti-sigma regulatory factor/PAS domain-containing protein